MNNILGSIEEAISAVITLQQNVPNRAVWRKLQVLRQKLETAWSDAYSIDMSDAFQRPEVK